LLSLFLTFAKSIGWITILAKVAAEPPQAKGSIFLAKLVVGFSTEDILIADTTRKY
jgi:hypothetical protein